MHACILKERTQITCTTNYHEQPMSCFVQPERCRKKPQGEQSPTEERPDQEDDLHIHGDLCGFFSVIMWHLSCTIQDMCNSRKMILLMVKFVNSCLCWILLDLKTFFFPSFLVKWWNVGLKCIPTSMIHNFNFVIRSSNREIYKLLVWLFNSVLPGISFVWFVGFINKECDM